MKRFIALILSLTTLFTLAACKKDGGSGGGKSGDTAVLTDAASAGGESGISYTAKTLLAAESELGFFHFASASDDGIYASVYTINEDTSYTYRLVFIDTDGNRSDLPSDWIQGGQIVSMTRCPDGGVWIIKSLPLEDEDAPYEHELGRLTKEGYTPLSGAEIPTGLTVMQMCAAGSKIFVSLSDFKGTNLLTAYNSDGTTEYSIDMDTSNYSITGDGERMYMLDLSDDGVSERRFILYSFDPDSQAKEELFSFTQGNLLACEGDKVYIGDSTTLYVYDAASGSTEQVLRWASVGMGGASVFLYPDGKGGFLACHRNIGIKHLTPVEGGGEKQQVVLAVNSPVYPSGYVLQFNEANTEYEVIIKNYNSYPDPQTMLNTEMMAGNGPDIIDIMTFSGEMLNPNAMVDLIPLIEADPDMGVDSFLEGPLKQMMTEDGRLPAIAPTFRVHTFMCLPGAVDSVEFNGVIDGLNKMGTPEEAFGTTMSKDYFLLLAFACGGAENYSVDDVKAILEYTSKFPDEPIHIGGNEALKSGAQKMNYDIIGSAWAFFAMIEGTYEREKFDDLTIFGLPFREGTGIISPVMYFAIPANANCQEGAWAFIKSTVAPHFDPENINNFMNEFPILKSDYESVKESDKRRAQEEGIKSSTWRSGKEEEIIYDTADFYNLSDQLLAGVNGINTNDQAIYNIVSDSAAPYFHGEKSLDDAANEIMSRLEIYFAEKS